MMSRNLLVVPITLLMLTLTNCGDRRSCDDVVCGNNVKVVSMEIVIAWMVMKGRNVKQ